MDSSGQIFWMEVEKIQPKQFHILLLPRIETVKYFGAH